MSSKKSTGQYPVHRDQQLFLSVLFWLLWLHFWLLSIFRVRKPLILLIGIGLIKPAQTELGNMDARPLKSDFVGWGLAV